MNLKGKVSWFGGPQDTGVSPSEGLAFIYEVGMAPHLFLSYQPEGTSGLARRLNPDVYFLACRWDYDQPDTSKTDLLTEMALVRSPKTRREFKAYPADWGPNENTGRVADVSKGLLDALGIQTDDEVEVVYPFTKRGEVDHKGYDSIVISSGHSLKVRGAAGVLDEVDEARRVVGRLAQELTTRGIEVKTFHDDVSTTQNENLNRIVNFHNAQERDLDVSVHFNAYVETTAPMGTEVLYVTQSTLASNVSAAIASNGFLNRGGKKRTDLFFLNQTKMPSILIEVCFVDSSADADLYNHRFSSICNSIAEVLSGVPSAPKVSKKGVAA